MNMRRLIVIAMLAGCASQASPATLEGAAGATYAAEHMWCVEQFKTDPEINACRAAVRRRWGR